MNRKIFFVVCLWSHISLFALEEEELTWDEPLYTVQNFHRYLQESLDAKDWWAVADYANIISYNFPDSPFAPEAAFLMGQAYFNLEQFELANEYFGVYLHQIGGVKHFEEAIQYKFQIAEGYRQGMKRRPFGSHKMPRILPAQEEAVAIYEEVITTLPHHEIAVQSLLGKAQLLAQLEDFKLSRDALQTLIRRFPKHDLAAEAYLEVSRTYLTECQVCSMDADLLELAEMNLKKFRQAFPREKRIQEAEAFFVQMQELFAKNLLDIGKFFDKTDKSVAAEIYYSKVVTKFPNSEAALFAREKLGSSPSSSLE